MALNRAFACPHSASDGVKSFECEELHTPRSGGMLPSAGTVPRYALAPYRHHVERTAYLDMYSMLHSNADSGGTSWPAAAAERAAFRYQLPTPTMHNSAMPASVSRSSHVLYCWGRYLPKTASIEAYASARLAADVDLPSPPSPQYVSFSSASSFSKLSVVENANRASRAHS